MPVFLQQSTAEFSLATEALMIGVFCASFLLWRGLVLPWLRQQRRKMEQKHRGARHESKLDSYEQEESGRNRNESVEWVKRSQAPWRQPGNLKEKGASAKRAEKQILHLLEIKEFTRALNLFRSLATRGLDRDFVDEDFFSAFIQAACRVNKADVCELLLSTMKRNGVQPSEIFWQTLLKMLSSRKLFTVCLHIWSNFKEQLPADKIVFSCLINAALEGAAAQIATEMLPKLRQCSDFEPKDYILVFRTHAASNDIDASLKALRELRAGLSPLMLNLVLRTCVQAKDPQLGLDVIHEVLAYQSAENSAMVVDAVSYNTIIKGFSVMSMPEKCFECFQEMHQLGIEPDDVTFGVLLDVCFTENNYGQAQKVMESLFGGGRAMDTVVCTVFIKGLVRAGKTAKALELYEEMKKHELAKPDVVTYSILIKACIEERCMERALLFLDDMAKAGLAPDDVILTHLLEGCYRISDLPLGRRIFEDLVERGVRPSDVTLMTLLKLMGRCGTHAEAWKLLKTWEQRFGGKPSVMHYTCLVSGCLRSKNTDQAWEGYEFMRSQGLTPDATVFKTLVPGMVASRNWERVVALVQHAVILGKPELLNQEAVSGALSQIKDDECRWQLMKLLGKLQIPFPGPPETKRAP